MPKAKIQKPQKPHRDPTNFFDRTWLILVILLIFAPAGIYLLWTHKKFDPVVRTIISVLFGAFFAFNSMSLLSPDISPPATPAGQTQPMPSQDEQDLSQDVTPEMQNYVPPILPSPEFSANRLLKVHFLDVGQGDCIVVQAPNGQTLLVDGGGRDSGELVTDYLSDLGVKKLMAVVATHPHEDHIGGLITVLESMPVKSVYMPNATHTTVTFADFLEAVGNSGADKVAARVGRSIQVDELDMAMLFMAPNSTKYDSLNDYSAVLKISYKDISFLLTGDAEALSEKEMLDYNRNVNSTVLKVGHHGSKTSSTDAFLGAVKPVYAVITSGQDNEYGYPHVESTLRLKASGVDILRTDVLGTLIIETDGEKLGVRKFE